MVPLSPSHAKDVSCACEGGVFLIWVLTLVQLAVTLIMGAYFFRQLRSGRAAPPGVRRENAEEMEKLRKMRAVHLTEPLSEHVRPRTLRDIVGQEEGVRALLAILGGRNPQHVLIYGPGGGEEKPRRALPPGRAFHRNGRHLRAL